MHIRLAEPTDFSAAASMSVDCFWNDELYVYTNRWREQFPDHFRDFFLRRHRLQYWSPAYIFFVAVTDPGDHGHRLGGRVVGYTVWQRKGTSEEAKRWQTGTYWGLLECTLLKATESYLRLIEADKSLDYARLAHFHSSASEDFAAIPEMWKLQNLCVHVDFQRQGIGSMLIDWGKEQAQIEQCPIGLESSVAARPMYLKNGFRKYGKMNIKDFPIDDVPVYIWEPRDMEGKWGMKKEEEARD